MANRTVFRTTMEFGALIRGQVLRQMKELAFEMNIDVRFENLGGWLSTSYGVTISGPQDKVDHYRSMIHDWLQRCRRDA